MINDLRNGQRFAMHGMAALVGQNRSLVGHVADISHSGIALNLHGHQPATADGRKSWLCRIVSPELPEPMEFVVRFVRPRHARHGHGLACAIADIDEKNRALLDAFEQKRQRSAGYH